MFELLRLGIKEQDWNDFEQEALPVMPELYRIAVWLTRDRVKAEDLVQETFTEALRSFHNYRLGTNCKAWLTKIMYNRNAKQARKLGRLTLVDNTEEEIAETIAFEPPVPQTITDEDVLSALKRIPGSFCEAVILADVEGFTYKEIAAALNVPVGTVMSRIHRGRKLLRMELTEYAKNYGLKMAVHASAKGVHGDGM